MVSVVRLSVMVGAVCLSVFGTASGASAADLRVTFAELTKLVQNIASGTKIYLNNVPGPVGGLFTSGSYVAITTTQQYPIPIPAKSFQALGSTYVYYVNDITSTSVRVVPANGALRLTVAFESEGAEAVADCLSGGCSLENALPDIEWPDAVVNVDFIPVRFNGSISLQVKNVTLGGSPRAVCKTAGGLLSRATCNIGLPFANRMINSLKVELPKLLKEQVNRTEIQQQFADGLKRYLTIGQAGEVAIGNISIEPNSLNVNFRFDAAGAAGNTQ